MRRILIAISTFALVCMAGQAHAEDIEIYTGVLDPTSVALNNPDNFPNILFIMDNSTSMSNTEPIYLLNLSSVASNCSAAIDPSAAYDKDEDYGYDGNADNDSNFYIYRGAAYQNRFFTPEQNVCRSLEDRINDNPNNPTYDVDNLVQWGTRNGGFGWDNRIDRIDATRAGDKVECQKDRGKYGITRARENPDNPKNCTNRRGRVVACTGSTPFYTNRPNDGIGELPFGGNQSNIRVVSGNYHDYLQYISGNVSIPGCPDYDPANPDGIPPEYAALPVVDELSDMCGGTGKDNGRSNNTFPNPEEGLRYVLAGTGNVYRCESRTSIMKRALTDVVATLNKSHVGLMQFNKNVKNDNTSDDNEAGDDNGATVIAAFRNIDEGTNRDDLTTAIDGIIYGLNTPITESLYEAARVMRGLPRYSGYLNNTVKNNLPTPQLLPNTDPAAFVAGTTTYKSPIVSQCQQNSIVLLSDGAPTQDRNFDVLVTSATDTDTTIGTGSGIFNASKPCDMGDDSDFCADDIANYLRTQDNNTSTQHVDEINTFTIGFNTGDEDSTENLTLKAIANAGKKADALPDSGFFRADNYAELLSSLQTIVATATSAEADVFSAPAVTVNAFNRLQNREDIYYALFKPESNPRWIGNVKKYKVNANAEIVDAGGDVAIAEDGFFDDEAQSFWSAEDDGSKVADGGAGEQIVAPRNLLGNTDGQNVVSLSGNDVDSALTQFKLATGIEGTVLPTALNIGSVAGDADNTDKIITWTLGVDIDNDRGNGVTASNQYVGDTLHSQPYVLSFGTSADAPGDIVFYTSNQGMVHAIDGETGDEKWAYIPDPDLFANLGQYYNRLGTDKVYGLDGEISFLVERDPTTSAITTADLFFGQRRGGNKLFAIDVKNAAADSAPVAKKWTIEGGTGDYARLGQTWAEPVVTKAEYCFDDDDCRLIDVLFVSGGYDEQYDDESITVASLAGSVTGNAVYMINAENGELLWMVGSDVRDTQRDLTISEMTHSIVSKPTVLDVNKDGAADIMYFTDISGQVFRVDFRASSADTSDISASDNSDNDTLDGVAYDDVSGGRIADLTESGVDRRFYNPVDIALLPQVRNDDSEVIAEARYVLATGSGYRAHPLNPEAFGNKMYVLYDTNVLEPLYDETFTPDLDGDDIGDAVYAYIDPESDSPAIIGASDLQSSFDLANTIGYYVNLTGTAEKILSPTLISDFNVVAVSYLPADSNTANLSASCNAGLGSAKAYSVNLLTGGITEKLLEKPGITASPVIVYVLDTVTIVGEDGEETEVETLKPVVIIGTEPFEGEEFNIGNIDLGKADKKVWWESGRAR